MLILSFCMCCSLCKLHEEFELNKIQNGTDTLFYNSENLTVSLWQTNHEDILKDYLK